MIFLDIDFSSSKVFTRAQELIPRSFGGHMDCRQVHQAYSVYIQGKLSPQQTTWVNQHIQDCPDCRLLDQKVRNDFVVEKTGQALPEPVVVAAAPAALAMGDPDRVSRLRSEDRVTWMI